jgi:hypothetical protein
VDVVLLSFFHQNNLEFCTCSTTRELVNLCTIRDDGSHAPSIQHSEDDESCLFKEQLHEQAYRYSWWQSHPCWISVSSRRPNLADNFPKHGFPPQFHIGNYNNFRIQKKQISYSNKTKGENRTSNDKNVKQPMKMIFAFPPPSLAPFLSFLLCKPLGLMNEVNLCGLEARWSNSNRI